MTTNRRRLLPPRLPEMRRSCHLIILLGACLLAGCADPASDALSETADELGAIRSGELDLEVVLAGSEELGGGDVGFRLSGPFALGEPSELPVADLSYTQLAGQEEGGGQFISTGDQVFVELEGTTYELPKEQVEALRVPEDAGSDDSISLLGNLELAEWVQDAEVADGGEATERISGEVDIVKAVNDMLATASQFGASEFQGLSALEGEDAEQVRNAVSSATIEVVTGSEDRLLRDLQVKVTFSVPEDVELDESIKALLGSELSIGLSIANPNEPVEVDAPPDAVPFGG